MRLTHQRSIAAAVLVAVCATLGAGLVVWLGGDLGGGWRRRHCGRRRRGLGGLRRRGLLGLRRARAGRGGGELAEKRADRDRVAGVGDDLAQDAGARRVDFEGDLVGFEFDKRFVREHGLALLLEPFADRRLADRFAERRNADFSRHGQDAPFRFFSSQGVTEVIGESGRLGRTAIESMGKFSYTKRSEEHTSELQSPKDLVCRLLLEKK